MAQTIFAILMEPEPKKRRLDSNTPLRPHQEECLKKLLETVDDGIVDMFCGTGKSMIMAKFAVQHDKVVKFFPSIPLVYQFLNDYDAVLSTFKKRLIVCSSNEVASAGGNDFDVLCTTDSSKIESFLEDNCYDKVLVLCTYHSSRRLYESLIITEDFNFDLTLFDEAHNVMPKRFLWDSEEDQIENIETDESQNETYVDEYEDDDDSLSDNSSCNSKDFGDDDYGASSYCFGRRLFFSATVPQLLKKSYPTLFEMDCGEAIQEGIIRDYDIVCPLYGAGDLKELPEDSDERQELLIECIAEAMVKYNKKRVILFHRYSFVRDNEKRN